MGKICRGITWRFGVGAALLVASLLLLGPATPVQGQEEVAVTFLLPKTELQEGEVLRTELSVANASQVVAALLILEYSPDFLLVEDANPARPDRQVIGGPFWTAGNPIELENIVDELFGEIVYEVELSQPVSGSGVILAFDLRGINPGPGEIRTLLVELELADGRLLYPDSIDLTLNVLAGGGGTATATVGSGIATTVPPGTPATQPAGTPSPTGSSSQTPGAGAGVTGTATPSPSGTVASTTPGGTPTVAGTAAGLPPLALTATAASVSSGGSAALPVEPTPATATPTPTAGAIGIAPVSTAQASGVAPTALPQIVTPGAGAVAGQVGFGGERPQAIGALAVESKPAVSATDAATETVANPALLWGFLGSGFLAAAGVAFALRRIWQASLGTSETDDGPRP